MTSDAQLPEPAAELVRVARGVTAAWMRRSIVAAATAGGVDVAPMAAEIDELVSHESDRLLSDLAALLATDVDEQRAAPLSLYRAAVAAPTAWLRKNHAAPPRIDEFAGRAFPDDVYGLGPATWSDIDPALHEPGIVWGAWKAMTVLRRRRDEGRS